MTPSPQPLGIYRHYKGRLYEVLGTAQHSETDEVLVLYRVFEGNGDLWVRPQTMFNESVSVDGVEQPRFNPHSVLA